MNCRDNHLGGKLKSRILFVIISFFILTRTGLTEELSVTSPNGRIRLQFQLRSSLDSNQHRLPDLNVPFYSVTVDDKPVVLPSPLGLVLGGAPTLSSNFSIADTVVSFVRGEWNQVYGERAVVKNNYNQLLVKLTENIKPHRTLHLYFRVYDEGIAFRYTIPEQPGVKEISITKELTWFRFPEEAFGWVEYGTEEVYRRLRLPQIRSGCLWPLTVELPNGLYACVTEAAVDNYCRSSFDGFSRGGDCLRLDMNGSVRGEAPLATPWRAILIADNPAQLLQNNDMILNLNEPNRLQDVSWIKPGKVIREVTLSTTGAKACVDFAVDRGLDYIEFDAGWYGHEYADSSDVTTVTVDPKRNPKNDLDLQEAIRYARSKGIGVLLYVNRRALERQADEVFPLLEKWGVAGVKFGFVNVGPQEWTVWLHDLVARAAQHHLMVDIHDAYRPSGLSRTLPNLMTQEGVRGNEHRPSATDNCILPFTRFIAGAADCTPLYFARKNTTYGHQLALAIVFYSPLQFLFWYDKPALYSGESELELWKQVPTVWDDTRVLQGRIGEQVVVARRSGDEWYVGCLTNNDARTVQFDLSFLDKGKRYSAVIYSDDLTRPEGTTRVSVREQEVDSETIIKASMVPSGGYSMRIFPQ